MQLSASDLVLVTGATGLVGSHVVERLHGEGANIRALVRAESDCSRMSEWCVQVHKGSLMDLDSLQAAAIGVTHVVHCAAKVGDWGPIEEYRRVNVDGLSQLIEACRTHAPGLKRFVHISSLGVYQARDHYGTDESQPPSKIGIDGYTLSKVEAEELLLQHIRGARFPAVLLRPGFVYGPRDRTVLPKLIERLKAGSFAYLGSGQQLLNNVYARNLAEAVSLALRRDGIEGEVFNVTDGRLVTRLEFIETICRMGGIQLPTKHVPLPIARALAGVLESAWRLRGKQHAPLLSQARIKFLGLHLDYSIDKARLLLEYDPKIDFQQGMQHTMEWAAQSGLCSGAHPNAA